MARRSEQPVRLVVCGASGRMGARIIALAEADPRFQVMAGVEKAGSEAIGRFITSGIAPVVGNIEEVILKSDVVIDFTAREASIRNAALAARHRKALVVGTTGLTGSDKKKIAAAARKTPIVFSPNMSVGVNVLFRLVEQAAKTLAHYDIEIVEAHHNQKKDAPSGTAMKLAEMAAAASNRFEKDFVYGRRGLVGARKKKEIAVLAVRAGDIVGDHTVLFSTTGERLELIHRAHSRDALATGALTAAAWVARRKPGLYSMADVLRLTAS